VRIKNEFHKDVAKHYRVTQAAVSKLVVSVKRNPKLFSELLNKKEEE
jgi:hypothetical protein